MASRRMDAQVDTVVIGGGPAGSATALGLVERGQSVLVVERSRYAEPRVGEAFPPAIGPLLAGLRALEPLSAVPRVPSFGIRSVWGGSEPFDRSFVLDAHGSGWHVDRRAFDAALAEEARQRGACVRLETTLRGLEPRPSGGWVLDLDTHGQMEEVTASFVVDATGRSLAVARRLGSTRRAHDTLVAIVGFCAGAAAEAEQQVLLIEAVEDGWWYSAPIPAGQLVVAFMTDADLAGGALVRDEGEWRARMESAPHTSARASHTSDLVSRRVYAASSSCLDTLAGRRWLAVGDAAVAHDPLAGDGVCRSLASGSAAAEAIAAAAGGDGSALRAYAALRERDFDAYLQQRHAFYARELRWPTAPFWRRRHAAPLVEGRPAL